MAFPHRMAALPRLLNPLVLPLTRRVPPLAVLHHKGRRSGRSYDTPVQAYATPEGWVVGLATTTMPRLRSTCWPPAVAR